MVLGGGGGGSAVEAKDTVINMIINNKLTLTFDG